MSSVTRPTRRSHHRQAINILLLVRISAGIEAGATTDNAGGGAIRYANGRVARRGTSLTAAPAVEQ